MGNGRLLIGQGVGEASVWDSSPAVQSFNNIVAQQRAQREAEKKALIDQMGSIKTDGLRDADRNAYFDKYNQWANVAKEAANTRTDQRKKMELNGLAQQKYNELRDFVSESKKYASQEQQLGNMLLQDSFRHQFKDDSVQKIIQSRSLSINDPNYIRDANMLERQPDNEKVNTAFDKIDKIAEEKTQWSNPIQSKNKQGNKEGVIVFSEKRITPEDVFIKYASQYDLDPDVRKSLQDRYPDLQGETPAETKLLRIQQIMKDRGVDKGIIRRSKPEFKSDYRPRITVNVQGQAPTPTTQLLPYGDKAKVQAKDYIGLSIPKRNFPGTPAYDLTSGQKVESLASSGDYEIVGVGNFPFITKGNMKGGLAQPDFQSKNPQAVSDKPMVHVKSKENIGGGIETTDYLIEYDKLPANIKSSKAVKEALANFRPASGEPQSDIPKSITYKGKTYTQSAIDAAAKASGMSVKEYLKALGQ